MERAGGTGQTEDARSVIYRPMTDPIRDYLTVGQLRTALGVSRPRAYQLLRSVPPIYLHRTAAGILVDRSALEDLRHRNRRPGRPKRPPVIG